MIKVIPAVGLSAALMGTVAPQMLPDSEAHTINELEHTYLDKAAPNGFMVGVSTCNLYFDSVRNTIDPTLGRATPAQWIRVAFHDQVTADVRRGTGGIDASVGFESERRENFGIGIRDSLVFFNFFITAKLSMADLIATGTAAAIGRCGGPKIPLRGGRIDASAAGPPGVPEPEDDVRTTLGDMSRSGFNQADSIALTACGHTMGGVHHDEFPEIVPASAIGPNNSKGRQAFDETVDTFDNNKVKEYVDGTGKRGGPLVTTFNETVRSDLRLFSSDRNATMKKLARSSTVFQDTCKTLMGRMIDTVPRKVRLTAPLDPDEVKYNNLTLSLDWSGKLSLRGYLRFIETGQALAPTDMSVSVLDRRRKTATKVKAITDRSNQSAGVYGPTYHYAFDASFPGEGGLSAIEVDKKKFPLQDDIFVVKSLSSVSPSFANAVPLDVPRDYAMNITVALRGNRLPQKLKGTLTLPVNQTGTISYRMDSSTQIELDQIGTAGPYTLYSVLHKWQITGFQAISTSLKLNSGRGPRIEHFKVYWVERFL